MPNNVSDASAAVPRRISEGRFRAHRILNVVKLTRWSDLHQLASALPGWVYRGQRLASWGLSPRLERDPRAATATSLYDLEYSLLNKFKEQAPISFTSLRDTDDWMRWFALMQHHDRTTRFLDFTESIEIAAFFALTHKASVIPEEDAALWAVNSIAQRMLFQEQLVMPGNFKLQYVDDLVGGGLFNYLYGTHSVKGFAAAVARPPRIDARIRAQRGLFLFSLNLDHTLEENLYGMYNLSATDAHFHAHFSYWMGLDAPHIIPKLQRSPVIKIILAKELFAEGRAHLESTGITYDNLFPTETAQLGTFSDSSAGASHTEPNA